jgi:ribulose-5-phosphate 4-epimerase/fuculose-1-phosphate aldolase
MKILCSKKSKKFSKFRIFPDQVVFNGIKSCLVPYATPGDDLTKIIIKRVTKFIKNEGYFPKLILLKNHGIITCGVNENECVIITEICEKSAEIFLGSQILGETIFLKFKKIRELSKDIREKYRKSKL